LSGRSESTETEKADQMRLTRNERARAPKAMKAGEAVMSRDREKGDPLRTCRWPGCGKQVQLERWGCRRHWFQLPKELRWRMLESWSLGNRAAFDAAIEEADGWALSQYKRENGS
jgi:hypothetical protein